MSGKETCDVNKKFICSFKDCDKTFGRHSRFLIHLRTHTGEKPFVCHHQECGKAYARAQHLKRHVEVTHSNNKINSESQKYSCALSDCEKSFVSEDNLKRHIKTVHGKQYKYRCTVEGCKKKFTEENQLKRHELQHNDSNPYLCLFPGCNYSCKIAHQLKRHSKIHEGYKCKEEGCDVKLETWSLLRKHIMIHHSKVFECADCHLKYKKKIQLKRHSLVHSSDQKFYECEHEGCERVYLDLRNLRAHIKSYHDGHRLHCSHEGCSQTFVNKAKLIQHSKLHDPNKPPPKKMPKKGHRKKTAVENLTNLIEGSSSLVPVSDGDCSDVDKILLNDSGVVVDCSDKLMTISEVTSPDIVPDTDTSVSLESFTKDVNMITSLRNESNPISVQSSENLNDSSPSMGSDNSQNLIAESQFYENEEPEAKHFISDNGKLDAVDVWLEAMAENIATDTTEVSN